MSTFQGLITDLPNVSVDRFDGDNLKSTCFFLSHCHTDHMVGLKDCSFHDHLKNNNYFIYCSSISKLILLNSPEFSGLQGNIVEIRNNVTIEVPETEDDCSYTVNVSVVPAGHCPGSVMFLFETILDKILYTGDFRLLIGDVKKFKQFQHLVGKITKCYFDSTFFDINYYMFPSREESVEEIISIIETWRQTNDLKSLYLVTPANYGSEQIYIELAHYFKCKIHINNKFYTSLRNIPQIGCVLTDDCGSTFIHVKSLQGSGCLNKSDKPLAIKPAAMFFRTTKESMPEEISRADCYMTRVSYSSHCSYAELVDFLTYLKPKELIPCVVPVSKKRKEDLEKLIKNLMESWNGSDYVWKPSWKKRDSSKTSSCEFVQQRIKIPKQDHVVHDLLDSPPPRKF